jgi:hypothetical protein
LLHPQLLNKRLDIRIRGTKTCRWRNGVYESACGILVLTNKPKDTSTSVVVKVGYGQSRLHFLLHHLYPEHTTERPGFITAASARPIVSAIGERVVVIGPDLQEQRDYIGSYGVIIHCHWPLDADQALVILQTPEAFYGRTSYFHESSLCRSTNEVIDWFGVQIR